MSGSLVGGFLYDHVRRTLLLLAISTSGLATTLAATPYCSAFYGMLAVIFVKGAFGGSINASRFV